MEERSRDNEVRTVQFTCPDHKVTRGLLKIKVDSDPSTLNHRPSRGNKEVEPTSVTEGPTVSVTSVHLGRVSDTTGTSVCRPDRRVGVKMATTTFELPGSSVWSHLLRPSTNVWTTYNWYRRSFRTRTFRERRCNLHSKRRLILFRCNVKGTHILLLSFR